MRRLSYWFVPMLFSTAAAFSQDFNYADTLPHPGGTYFEYFLERLYGQFRTDTVFYTRRNGCVGLPYESTNIVPYGKCINYRAPRFIDEKGKLWIDDTLRVYSIWYLDSAGDALKIVTLNSDGTVQYIWSKGK